MPLFTFYLPYHNESKQAVLLKLDPLFCVYYRKGLQSYVESYVVSHLGNDSSTKKRFPAIFHSQTHAQFVPECVPERDRKCLNLAHAHSFDRCVPELSIRGAGQEDRSSGNENVVKMSSHESRNMASDTFPGLSLTLVRKALSRGTGEWLPFENRYLDGLRSF